MTVLGRLLGAVEARTQLDVLYYLKGATGLTAAQGVSMAVGLVSAMAFTRLVPREVYGQYNYIFSIMGLVAVFSIPGMTAAVNQAAARGFDQVFPQGTRMRMKWSLMGSVGLLSVGAFYLFQGATALGMAFIATAPFFPLYASADTFQSFLDGRRQFMKASTYHAITFLVSTLALIGVMYVSGSLLWMVATYLGAFSLSNLYFLLRTMHNEGLNQRSDKTAFGYAKHLTLQGIIPNVSNHYDSIIIAAVLGFQDLATYGIAVAALGLAKLPRAVLQRLAFPQIAALDRREAFVAVRRRLVYVVAGSAIVTGVGIGLLPLVVPALFTTAYAAAVPYAQVILLAEFLGAPGGALVTLFKAQRETQALYKVAIVSHIFKISLLTVLVPSLGLMGAVLVRVIFNLITTAVSLWLIRKSAVLEAAQ